MLNTALNVAAGGWPSVASADLTKSKIMGIINVTPDSFSGDGLYFDRFKVRQVALSMVKNGADIIDVGGESSCPGAESISLAEELDRVIPAIEAIRAETDVPISIDTMKSEVMTAAVAAGANFINDVNALQSPGALKAAIQCDVPVCLMHKQGVPKTMQHHIYYKDVVADVYQWLEKRIKVCVDAGIDPDKILIDVGFGFGKTCADNLALTKKLAQFKNLGCPIVFGASRKNTVGMLLNKPVYERMVGSVTLAVVALLQGASVVRVHDVEAMRDALTMLKALYDSSSQSHHEVCREA